MVRRLLGWIVVLPLAAVVLMLAVLNRGPATLAWNPLEVGVPGHGVVMPLYVFLLAAFALGALVGGFVTWNTQRRWRRAAKETKTEARRLAAEVDRLKTTGTSVAVAGR